MAPRPRQEAASAVEFALIAPVLFLMLFGLLQFGIWFLQAESLQGAAREGARLGSLRGSTLVEVTPRVEGNFVLIDTSSGQTCPVSASEQYCITVLVDGVATTDPTTPLCDASSGDVIEVRIDYRSTSSVPLLPFNSLDLSGKGDFTCE